MVQADGAGTFADPGCGERLDVRIKVKDGRIEDVLCEVEGCNCTRAGAGALGELARGKRLDEALALTDEDILSALGGQADPRHPCPGLGASALHRAVHDYLVRLVPATAYSFWLVAVGVVTRVADVSDGAPSGFPRLAELEIYPLYEPALEGVQPPASIWVAWWMHELGREARETLRAHPMGDPEAPHRGVFALRSPARPNPVGWALVKLVARDGRRLLVDGLDARAGSPILDIKPWSDRDRRETVTERRAEHRGGMRAT